MKTFLSRVYIFTIVTMVINSGLLCQETSFTQHPIDLSFQGIQCVRMIDLDRDGDIDIVGGSENTPYSASQGLAWWRNEGGNPVAWTKFVIDRSFVHVMSVDVADINGDKNPDIVATSWSLHEVAWWKNGGDPTLNWEKNLITTGFTNAHDAQCADVNSDGATDVIAVSSTPGSIVVFSNEAGTGLSWIRSPLATTFSGAKAISLVDLDKDGDQDVVGIADAANEIAWWENQPCDPVSWKKTVIASNFVGGANLEVIDLNLDGKYDILATSWKTNQVAYWLCSHLQNNLWTQTVVSGQLGIAAKALGCDVDHDGDVDIVAIGMDPGEVILFKNANSTWTKTVLSGNLLGGAALAYADVDGDGDQDVVAGAAFTGKMYWWENLTPATTGVNAPDTRPIEWDLKQNFPNPFNPRTAISYQLSAVSLVTLSVYDVLGREIERLDEGVKAAGRHTVFWDATSRPSGVYICQLHVADPNSGIGLMFTDTKKMVLVR